MITWGSIDGYENWFGDQPGWYELGPRSAPVAPDGGDHEPSIEAHGEVRQAKPVQDLSTADVLRLAHRSLFASDLLGPKPGWPLGARARRRRHLRLITEAEANRRRRQLRTLLASNDRLGAERTLPANLRARLAAAAAWTAAVAFIGAVAWWQVSGAGDPAQNSASWTTSSATHRSTTLSTPPVGSSSVLPAPPSGVPPVRTPPATAESGQWPTAVEPVPPPAPSPTADELASPPAAMVAWLSRWCPFDHTEPFGTPEQRARPAMTAAGWAEFDPDHDSARRAWEHTVAAKETGRCGAVTAAVLTYADGDGVAVVTGSAFRMVTSPDRPSYVEQLIQTRVVLRGTDGLWRIDIATVGG